MNQLAPTIQHHVQTDRMEHWRERVSCAHLVPFEHRVENLAQLHEWMIDNQSALDDDFVHKLLSAAECWCDWPLIIYLLGKKYEQSELDAVETIQLANASLQMGDLVSALTMCKRAMFLHPNDERVFYLYQRIYQWQQYCYSFAFYPHDELTNDEVSLELLGHHHYPSFQALYHDSLISELCCLPEFVNEAHWHDWLDYRYSKGDELNFAVLHRYWGMIGNVSLVMYDGIGFFYYWIGKEFRGLSYGPKAVDLMLDMAQQTYGMKACYARVFHHNTASQKGLEKMQFERLGFHSPEPFDDQYFYYRGEPQPRYALSQQLHWLFERMNSDARLAVPLCE